MTHEIQALPSVYKGVQFRSRLEARWAIFFDALWGVQWEYEPEGFVFDSETYLPDFKITFDRCGSYFAEVKPIGGDLAKACRFGEAARKHVLLLEGPPKVGWWKCYWPTTEYEDGSFGGVQRCALRDHPRESQVWYDFGDGDDGYPVRADVPAAVAKALSYRWGR